MFSEYVFIFEHEQAQCRWGGGLLAQAVATTRLGDQVGDLRLGAGFAEYNRSKSVLIVSLVLCRFCARFLSAGDRL